MNGRQLKVAFASDNKSGQNLKIDELKERDAGEIITESEVQANLYEMLKKHLSIDQKEMLMRNIKKICDSNDDDKQRMIALLEKDDQLCRTLTEIQQEVIKFQSTGAL